MSPTRGYPLAMTQAQEQAEQERAEQLRGDEAGLVNTARGHLTAFVDKLEALASEGREMLGSMDARLADFDRTHRAR